MTDRSASFSFNNVTAIVADPSSTYLYVATSDGYVYKWDAATGATVASSQVGTDISAMALSPDGSYLVTGEAAIGPNDSALFEKVATSDLSYSVVQVPGPTTYPADALESHRAGGVGHLVVTSDGTVFFNAPYALSGSTPTFEFSLADPANLAGGGPSAPDGGPFFLSEHGWYIAVPDNYFSPASLQVYNVATGAWVWSWGFGREPVAISDTAGLVVSGSGVYDLATLHLVAELSGSFATYDNAFGAAFTPDGNQLLEWDANANLLRIFDTHSWAEVGTLSLPAYQPWVHTNEQELLVGDHGQFLYLPGNGVSIDLAANLHLTVTGDLTHTKLIGAVGSDTITGSDANDTLVGYGGNDTLTGGLGPTPSCSTPRAANRSSPTFPMHRETGSICRPCSCSGPSPTSRRP